VPARDPAPQTQQPRRGVRRCLRVAGDAGVAARRRPRSDRPQEVRQRLPALRCGAVCLSASGGEL